MFAEVDKIQITIGKQVIRVNNIPSTTFISFNEVNEFNQLGIKLMRQLNQAIEQAKKDICEIPVISERQAAEKGLEKRLQLQKKIREDLRKTTIEYKNRLDKQKAQERSKLLDLNANSDSNIVRQRIKDSHTTELRNANDVTASLRRSRQLMAQQINRVENVTKVLDEENKTLQNTNNEYNSFGVAIKSSSQLLSQIERQARIDKILLISGCLILALTIFYIVYERFLFRFL